MEWLLDKLPVLIVLAVVVARILGALFKSRDAKTQHEQEHDESEEQRRVREIQERIRRAIAERRGRGGAESPPPATQPPVLHQEPTVDDDGDPFHEPAAQVPPLPEPQVAQRARNFELERQAELAEKMRELAEARELAGRRAASAAAMSESAALASAAPRHRFDELIRDRGGLRRAIVLREILGPPVGLR